MTMRIHDRRVTTGSRDHLSGSIDRGGRERFGHGLPNATLNTHPDLFEDDLAALAGRLDERLSRANVAPALPVRLPEVVELPKKAL